MRKGILAAALALLGGSGLAWGQEMPYTGLPIIPCVVEPACPCPPRIWGSSEYLLWWFKPQNLSTPLVTSSTDYNDPQAGGVGRPGTSILLGPGGQGLDYGPLSGGRVTIGGWLDRSGTLGVEGRGFWLQQGSVFRTYAGSAGGVPLIGNPINDVANGGSVNAIVVSSPLPPVGFGSSGDITVFSHSQLWGAEVNGILNLLRNKQYTLDVLGGFRYVDLKEDLGIIARSTNLVSVGNGGGVAFLNNPFDGRTTTTDLFRTRNQFYGGTLGARAEADLGRFIINVTGKVSLGYNHQSSDIQGNTVLETIQGTTARAAGGIYALPSNIGQNSHNVFSVMPEVEAKVAYKLTQRLNCFVGYNFMYMSEVARPGQQINPSVDTRQVPVVPGATGYDGNPHNQPGFQPIRNTGFWAQGVNFGIEFRF